MKKNKVIKAVVASALCAAVFAGAVFGIVHKARATEDCGVWTILIQPVPSGQHTDEYYYNGQWNTLPSGQWTSLTQNPSIQFRSTLPGANHSGSPINTIQYSCSYISCVDGSRIWYNGYCSVPNNSYQTYWQTTTNVPPTLPIVQIYTH